MRSMFLLLFGLLVACGDDIPKKNVDQNNLQDIGPDAEEDLGDGGNDEDTAPDSAPECALVDCIENSQCVVADGLAFCECLPGFETQDTLCVPVNAPPMFTNLPGEEVGQQGQPNSFVLTASDPNQGDTLTFGLLESTCGFDIQVAPETGAVSWVCPASAVTCSATMQVRDDSGLSDEGVLTVRCVQDVPVSITNLPTTQNTLWRRSGSFQVTATGPQPLTFSRTSSDCGFQVNVSSSGQITYTCGNGVGACNTVVTASNGQGSDSGTFTVNCTNTTPSVSNVAISPTQPTSPGQPLTCNYTFSDADGDTDNSSVSWLVNGVVSGSSSPFSNYGEGDQVTCRVTPNDGLTNGPAVTSSLVTGPLRLIVGIGGSHMCARTAAGGVRCWGDNLYAKVGGANQASGDPPYTPITPTGMGSGVTHLAVGSVGTCAIQNGAAKCWGGGNWGVQGPTQTGSNPTPITVLASGVTELKMGSMHVCGLHNGALKCWGGNGYGQAGNTTGNNTTFGQNSTPTTVSGMASGVTRFSAGQVHTCAVQSGALKCWGNNQDGQLGVDTNIGSNIANPTPTQVPGLTSGVTEVYTGDRFTCALHNSVLKCWGANTYQQLGYATAESRVSTPTAVTSLTGSYSALVAGGEGVCFIQSNEMKCWGSNVFGEHNRLSPVSTLTPVSVYGPTVTAIDIGSSNGCAVRAGELYCWGSNFYGQMGTGVASPANSRFSATLINL